MNAIPTPSKVDVDSIGSHYAAAVLEKMPRSPRKTLESLLNNCCPPQALDLVQRLLLFAPQKRLAVEQCLVHPFVYQFHNPVDEPSLAYDVALPLPDHIQLSIDDYRSKLYDLITQKKTHIRRIQHENRPIRVNADYTKSNRAVVVQRSRADSMRVERETNQVKRVGPESRKAAPIAQAECSDTDFDTARTGRGGDQRERAQSADSRRTVKAAQQNGVSKHVKG